MVISVMMLFMGNIVGKIVGVLEVREVGRDIVGVVGSIVMGAMGSIRWVMTVMDGIIEIIGFNDCVIGDG